MGTGFVKRNHRVAIGFDEIEVGDKIRVTYTTGQKRTPAKYGHGARSTTCTLVAVAGQKSGEGVWLCTDGGVLADKGWQELEIDRVSSEPVEEAPVRHREPWSAEDDRVLGMREISDARAAKRLGRTYRAVVTRRHLLRSRVAA